MKDWKTIFTDDESMLPEEGIVNLVDIIEDERGFIQELANLPIKSVYLIHSKKHALRANHWHKTDWHFCYVLKGKIAYYSRKHGSNKKPKRIVVDKGEMVFTPAKVDHAMYYLDETEFVVLSRNARDYESYMADVEYIQLVSKNDL